MTSPRSIERRLEDLNAPGEEYPTASLVTILSSEEFVCVDPEEQLYQLDGGVYHIDQNMREVLRGDA